MKIKNVTLSIVLAIFIAVSVTNFLWIREHKTFEAGYAGRLETVYTQTDSICDSRQTTVADSMESFNLRIADLEAKVDSLESKVCFVNNKVNVNCKWDQERSESIFINNKLIWATREHLGVPYPLEQ